MPELAEVEFYRKRWLPGLRQPVAKVALNPQARVFREVPRPQDIAHALRGECLRAADAHGKQLRFCFSGHHQLGVHLGMTGRLHLQKPGYVPDRHDHLVFFLEPTSSAPVLVFTDPRMFGRLRWFSGPDPAPWWSDLPPQPMDRKFTRPYFLALLQSHPRTPLKAFLLNQDRCPGIGNWMADEICFRARLHPADRLQSLSPAQQRELWRRTRQVARDALRVIGTDWSPPPESWLFPHRWRDGGCCPRDGTALIRESIAGRTTAFCPVCQIPAT